MIMNKNIIKIKNLYTELHSKNKSTYSLTDGNITIEKGSSIGIVGESGSGKTQLFKAITGTQQMIPGIVQGEVLINYEGKQFSMYTKDENDKFQLNTNHIDIKKSLIGFIPQDPKSFLNPYWTLKQIFKVTYNLKDRIVSIDEFLAYYLELVDIDALEYADKYPKQLSGGQAQRVMIALVLSKQPELIIADELTTGLDVTRQKKIIDTFKKIKSKNPNITTIYISHDFGFLTHVVDSYYVMYGGFIVEHINNTDKLSNHQSLHPYTQDLLKSLNPENVNKLEDELSINSKINFKLKGCPYVNKCSHITNDIKDKCVNSIPALYNSDNNQLNVEDDWMRCWKGEKE